MNLHQLLAQSPGNDEYGVVWLIVGVLAIICLLVWLFSRFR